MPENLEQYLEAVENYLEQQEAKLSDRWKNRNPNLDYESVQPFPALIQAIECVRGLKTIDEEIAEYWIDLA